MTEAHGRKRQVAMAWDLPGTPEQVWQAIATGPGISAWFTPTTVEEGEGGAIHFDLGPGMASSGHVTAWQPPHFFAYEEANWSEGAPPLASEWRIEARAGGGCTLRLVHSLFTENARWDEELDGMEAGWPGFVRVLRFYLAHFPGQAAASFRATTTLAGEEDAAWAALQARLGLAGAQVGQAVGGAPGDAPPWAGRLEGRGQAPTPNELSLVLEAPAPGLALWGAFTHGGQVLAAFSFYFYGPEAAAMVQAQQPLWQAWMDGVGAGPVGAL